MSINVVGTAKFNLGLDGTAGVRYTSEGIRFTDDTDFMELSALITVPTEGLMGAEVYYYKAMSLLVTYYADRVGVALYTANHTQREIALSARYDYPIKNPGVKPGLVYSVLVGRILTDFTSDVGFFKYGSGYRQMYSVILNHMLSNALIDIVFTAPFGMNMLNIDGEYVEVTKPDGHIIYRGRTNRLHKTLLQG